MKAGKFTPQYNEIASVDCIHRNDGRQTIIAEVAFRAPHDHLSAAENKQGAAHAIDHLKRGFTPDPTGFEELICAKSCKLCIPSRVNITNFSYSRMQRRILRENADLTNVRVIDGLPDVDHSDNHDYVHLLAKYRFRRFPHRHRDPSETAQYYTDAHMRLSYAEFFGMTTQTLSVRDRGWLRACHIFATAAAGNDKIAYASEHFYDDDEKHAHRRLGAFALLKTIEHLKENGFQYLYLGHWAPGTALAWKERLHIELYQGGAWGAYSRSGTAAFAPYGPYRQITP